MSTAYTFFANLAQPPADLPQDSILSRTVFQAGALKVIVFHFAAGQELSEHTAACPVTIHILSGEARLTLGEDEHTAQAGAWMHLPTRLPHSVYAVTPVTLALTMLPA